jgi:hypothetical protein
MLLYPLRRLVSFLLSGLGDGSCGFPRYQIVNHGAYGHAWTCACAAHTCWRVRGLCHWPPRSIKTPAFGHKQGPQSDAAAVEEALEAACRSAQECQCHLRDISMATEILG